MKVPPAWSLSLFLSAAALLLAVRDPLMVPASSLSLFLAVAALAVAALYMAVVVLFLAAEV